MQILVRAIPASLYRKLKAQAAAQGRSICRSEERDRTEKDPHSGAIQEGVEFLVRQRLPPIWIVDYDLAFEGAKSWLFATALCGTCHIDDGRRTAANSHRFSTFDGFLELGKLILGACNADFHFTNMAIYSGYVKGFIHRVLGEFRVFRRFLTDVNALESQYNCSCGRVAQLGEHLLCKQRSISD